MSKFLTICEEYDPNKSTNHKYELYDFLKEKGIKVSIIRNTDMLYIDTGTNVIPVIVKTNEEDSQEYEAVKDAANDPNDPNSPKAQTVIARRKTIIPKAINKLDQQTKDLEKSVNKPIKKSTIQSSY